MNGGAKIRECCSVKLEKIGEVTEGMNKRE